MQGSRDDIESNRVLCLLPRFIFALACSVCGKVFLMRFILILPVTSVLFLATVHGQDCACETPIEDPLAENAGMCFGDAPGQLYPYDRQDP